jgi:serine protease Do
MQTNTKIQLRLFIVTIAASLALAGCAAIPLVGDDDDDVTAPSAQALNPSAIEVAVEEVRPSVVFLSVRREGSGLPGATPDGEAVGSGVIFDQAGYVLTNNHVIEGATEITAILPDGRRIDAEILGRSPSSDLAIVQIEGHDLPVARLGDSDQLRIGQTVVAIGNALGLPGGPTVTSGVVSALGRSIANGNGGEEPAPAMEDVIQTDAAINPGNSGGPLINLNGEVVGINTARVRGAEGIGFAVSINQARRVIDQIIHGDPRPFLGITAGDVTPAVAERLELEVERGVLIIDLNPDGPAEQAGLQPGDVILFIDDNQIDSVSDLLRLLDDYEPGDQVEIRYHREGEDQTTTLTLGESPIFD